MRPGMLIRLTRGGDGHRGRGERDSRRGRESPRETALSHPDATGKPFFERIVNFSINFFGATVREPAVKSD